MRWPGGGIAGGTTYEGLTSHVDFIPTLFRLLGKDVPDRVEGVDFAPTAGTGREEAGRREIHAIWHGNDSRCIRTEQYKLIRNFSPRRRVVTPIDLSGPRYENWFGGGGPVPSAELYDIKADPWEMNDLAGSSGHAAVFRDLNQRLYAWMSRVNDPILQGRMVDPWYRAAIADFKSQST
jgi:arylsulfatase A-like enzyme